MSDKSSIKYILSLSIPIFFANLATPLVGIVDTTLMGNMSNQGYLTTATSIDKLNMYFIEDLSLT